MSKFPKGSNVWAKFAGDGMWYEGKVVAEPAGGSKEYKILFDGFDEPETCSELWKDETASVAAAPVAQAPKSVLAPGQAPKTATASGLAPPMQAVPFTHSMIARGDVVLPIFKDMSLPECPAEIGGTENWTKAQIDASKKDKNVLDDFLRQHPLAEAQLQTKTELRTANVSLASLVSGSETTLANSIDKCRNLRRQIMDKKAEVEKALAGKAQQSAEESTPVCDRLCVALGKEAMERDGEAERVADEAKTFKGTLNSTTLEMFKKSYVNVQAEKHWRLAIKQTLA